MVITKTINFELQIFVSMYDLILIRFNNVFKLLNHYRSRISKNLKKIHKVYVTNYMCSVRHLKYEFSQLLYKRLRKNWFSQTL